MEWGIIASVLVAIALFVLGAMVLFGSLAGLLVWLIKRSFASGGRHVCPMPGCPFAKAMESELHTAEHEVLAA